MKRILSGTAAILSAILVFISCNKIDATDLGSGIIPEIDNVNTFDTTISVISDNFFSNEDTVRMIYTARHSVGFIENDPEFGQTSTLLYTAFAPSATRTYPFVKRDSVTIDSVVLSLAYAGSYGDSASQLSYEVREIDPSFDFRDTGYSVKHPDFPTQSQVIGSRTVVVDKLHDSIMYRNQKDTVKVAGELRIPLDLSWAGRFINYDTTNAYKNDSIFQQRFRGVEVRAAQSSPQKKALTYFNLTDNAKTRITFYCRVQNNGKTDTIAPFFQYKTGYPEASMVRSTPAGAYLANINNGLVNDEQIYIQSTTGSYATIQIPALSNLPNAVIHRAELIMDKVPSLEENFYAPPPRLFIEALSGDTVFTIRNDFIPANSAIGYDLTTLGGTFSANKYVFNLSRYTQSILTKGYRNYTLRVSSPFIATPTFLTASDMNSNQPFPLIINPMLGGGRVIVYGGGFADPSKAMRLRIIYSKI